MVSSRLLRRVPAAVLAAGLLAALSCSPPHQWENLGLVSSGDRPVPLRGTVTDATCRPDGTCLVLQQAPGDAVARLHRWSGGEWAMPAAPLSLTKVSCGADGRCAGITADGVAGWDGTRWQSVSATALWGEPAPAVRHDTAVSCGTGACMAGDSGRTAVWDGTTWTANTSRISAGDLSCTSVGFCLATGASGDVSRWDGTTWSTVARIRHPGDGVAFSTVSCGAPDRCAIIGAIPRMPVPGEPFPSPGNAFLYWWDGTALKAGTPIAGARDVACTPPNQCVAARGQQPPVVFTNDGRRDQPVPPVDGTAPELTIATCTTGRCLVAGHAGHAGQGSTSTPVVYQWEPGPDR